MRFRIARHAACIIALGGAVAGCGGEEVFEPQLRSNERLIDREAIARLSLDDQGLSELVVAGDLDGDDIDDAVIQTHFSVDTPDGTPSTRPRCTCSMAARPSGTRSICRACRA